MSTPEQSTLAERLVVALDPSPSVREIAARRIVEFAAQLDDDAILGDVVDAAENPKPVRSAELARRAGLSYRQVNYWTTEGYLVPLRNPRGSGFPAKFAPETITKARIMSSLVRMFAMMPNRASEIAEEILRAGSVSVEGYTITRHGRTS